MFFLSIDGKYALTLEIRISPHGLIREGRGGLFVKISFRGGGLFERGAYS